MLHDYAWIVWFLKSHSSDTWLLFIYFVVGDGNQKEIIATGNRNKKLEVLTVSTFLWTSTVKEREHFSL